MKNRMLISALLWGVLVLLPLSIFGQTALTSTTLNEAVDDTERRIDVTADSGALVGDIAFVDREAMLIIAVDATNERIRVQRGYGGTVAEDHANGAVIWLDRPSRFISKDLSGSCTVASEFPNFTPLINISNGNRYACVNSVWSKVGWQPTGLVQSIETTTAVDVITSEQCGSTIFLNNATGYLTTLPVPTAGCEFKFFLVTLLSSGNHTIATNASANIIIGHIKEGDVTTNTDAPGSTVGDLVTFVGSAETLGDYVEFVSDGTSWFMRGRCFLVAGITIGST